MKVLVVDDKEDNRYLLEKLLTGYGHTVVLTKNGKEALEELNKTDIQMIISDILMPVMDGFQFCHEVRKNKQFDDILFVFFTATYLELEDEKLAEKLGADLFIRKPLEPELFMKIINQLIQDVEDGKVKSLTKVPQNEKEIFKLYNQRLVNKLEEKMMRMESEVRKRRQAEVELKSYFSQLEKLVEDRTKELTQANIKLEKEIAKRTQIEDALRQSEEMVKAQFRGIPNPIYAWHKRGKEYFLINYNIEAEKITGGKIKNFLGKTLREVHAHQLDILTDFDQCFESKSTIQREIKYQYKTTGKEAFLIVTYVFIPPDFILVHTQDITTHYQTEKALREARNQLEVRVEERTFELTKANRQLKQEIEQRIHAQEELLKEKEKAQIYLDIAGVIMVVVGSNQLVSMVNKKGCEILRYSAEEIIGKNWFDHFLPERDRSKVKNVFNKIISGEVEPFEYFENTVLTKDGEERLIAWNNASIKNSQGKLIGTLSSGQDITEVKKAQELMLHSEKMITVAGLAAGMAHEINNPLAGILQSVQVIQNRISNEFPINQEKAAQCGTTIDALRSYCELRKISELLTTIKESGQRAAVIVENMLSFSRKSESKFLPHNIPELLDKIITLAESEYDLKKKYDFRKIKIKKEYSQELPLVHCDATRIQQVILNLLKNAAQAMLEAKTPSPGIVLRTMKMNDLIRIEVSDNGPGIPEHIRKRIFEPFFTTKEVGSGTGLGLSVSFFIITENHKGTMEVESTPGKGTTFIIHLPIKTKKEIPQEIA